MKIPPYWAKTRYEGKDRQGGLLEVITCGWSFSSLQEAHSDALARAKRVVELLSRGQKLNRYEYHDLPIKEEILKQIHDGEALSAIVTRNRYGALVLNCSNVLFVDIDFPKLKAQGFIEAIVLAINRKKRSLKQQALIQETIRRVEEWAERNPQHSFRLYRTKEGLRLLFTGKPYDPASDETAAILAELQADPLYVKLTQKQECFRARLTPKPWRCGCSHPPNNFPWDTEQEENRYRLWEAEYTKRIAAFKVCELLAEFGAGSEFASPRTIVDIHDRGSQIEADAPLA